MPEIRNCRNWSAISQPDKPTAMNRYAHATSEYRVYLKREDPQKINPATVLLNWVVMPLYKIRKQHLAALVVGYSAFCSSPAFSQTASNILIHNWTTPTLWQPQSGSTDKKSQDTRGANGSAEEASAGANAAAASPSNPLALVAVPPCRLADTRSGGFLGGAFNGGDIRSLNIPAAALANSACAAIPTADAYSINVTVVPTSSLGFLSVFPNGQPLPLVSTLNWGPGASGGTVANAAIVPGGSGGVVNFYASAPAQVIVDINGYFLAGSGGVSAVYQISSTQSIPNEPRVTVNFDQKIKDTQNTVITGANWQFKAPVSGTYHVDTNISIGCTPLISSGYESIVIFVQPSGSGNPVGADFASEDNGAESLLMSSDIPLNAGDLLWIGYSHADASCGSYTGRIGIFLVAP
jgi:hypothetical protein